MELEVALLSNIHSSHASISNTQFMCCSHYFFANSANQTLAIASHFLYLNLKATSVVLLYKTLTLLKVANINYFKVFIAKKNYFM